ncbi:MAG TPA: DinB family protein [Longimicrobiales bacterium]|nr:DinB family protein [Longimicrobiales bacterium]
MPTTTTNNDNFLDERAREVRASIDAFRKLEPELAYLQLGWRPPEGGWSIAQVVEHLILTDEPYVDIITRLLQNAKRDGDAWKPSMFGGFVTRAVEPKSAKKVKALKGFQPGPEPRANAIADYIRLREKIAQLIEQSKGVDLNRARMSSPVMGLIRYNLGDAYMILSKHTMRHLEQIERIRKHPEFPKS